MPYPEFMIHPMRQELARLGIEEFKSSESVEEAVANTKGTLMIVVNSVCGCAAGKARPGIGIALQHAVKPDRVGTVFAGADIDATDTARGYFTGYPPSSPAVAILRDGKLVYMMQRSDVETRGPYEIAQELTRAFDEYCAPVEQAAG